MVQSLGRVVTGTDPPIRYRDEMIPKYLTRQELGREVFDTDSLGRVGSSHPSQLTSLHLQIFFCYFFIIFV